MDTEVAATDLKKKKQPTTNHHAAAVMSLLPLANELYLFCGCLAKREWQSEEFV